MRRALCWLGWHRWHFVFVIDDPDCDVGRCVHRKTYTRECTVCGDRDIVYVEY